MLDKSQDNFTEMAKKMGGGEPHATILELLSAEVKTEITNASFEPTNLEVRNALKKLRKECLRFTIALKGLDKILLELPAFETITSKTRSDIEGVAALCNQALEINPPRRGNPKAGMVMCASVVCEVWASIHKRPPGHNNIDAQDLCEEYWIACGQSAGTAGRWEHHIGQARRKSNRYRWISRRVARFLTEGN
jgi:hypothetical protein